MLKGGGFRFEMPFANHGRVVARFLHLTGKVLVFRFNSPVQVEHAVGLRILPRYDARPTRRADRVVTEDPVEAHPFARQAVEVRRGIQRRETAPITSETLGGVVVGHDEENVRLFFL